MFARIFVTYNDGSTATHTSTGKEELGEQLNFFQNRIMLREVRQVMVEGIDPLSKPIAEMFNGLASDWDKLRNTMQSLKDNSTK